MPDTHVPLTSIPEQDSPVLSAAAALLAIREATVTTLLGRPVRDALRRLSSGEAAHPIEACLPTWVHQAVLADLQNGQAWKHEYWALDHQENVSQVDGDTFAAVPPALRFSTNLGLRRPSEDATSLRAFLSALRDSAVEAALSDAFGEAVRLRSTDIAQYAQGHYLRPHADVFEDRRFGFVWFFSEGWTLGCGGELVVTHEDGNAVVIPPQAGDVASLLIRPGYQHQVAGIRSDSWRRFSIASHYHVSTSR